MLTYNHPYRQDASRRSRAWTGLSRYASSRVPHLPPGGHQSLAQQSTPSPSSQAWPARPRSRACRAASLPGQPDAWHAPGSQVPALDPRRWPIAGAHQGARDRVARTPPSPFSLTPARYRLLKSHGRKPGSLAAAQPTPGSTGRCPTATARHVPSPGSGPQS
jgi:hypothetical protein